MKSCSRLEIVQEILQETSAAIANGDWQSSYGLFTRIRNIGDAAVKSEILNQLLVTPGHELHQEVIREIQLLRSPSSVPYLRQILVHGFDMLEYTCSDAGVIAKWFSHALADINTPESIAVIREFAKSDNAEVAEEMMYRLRRLGFLT